MTGGTGHTTGFQPGQVNLDVMKEVGTKIIFIGDGMSGKTQILVTFGQLVKDYLLKIYLKSNDGSEMSLDQDNTLFKNWSEQNGFSLRYGNIQWDILDLSLDSETIGFEDFEYVFPYVWNDQTFKIKMIGNDVGGQNIFDNFRAVLGKIAGPNDNLIVVFDKSRELSCFNSMEQIKNVKGGMTSEKRWYQGSKISQMFFCGNKIDLAEHIQAQQWRDRVSQAFLSKILYLSNYGEGEYYLPSLVNNKKQDRIIKYKIENNRISFPDLEALFYFSIRETDSEYGKQIMGEVNTKALAREIAARLVLNQRSAAMDERDHSIEKILADFCSLLFRDRPLAMQYTGGFEKTQLIEEDSTFFGRVREKWGNFGASMPISKESVESALIRAASANELLDKMGEFYPTNAIVGHGIIEMIDTIIQDTLSKKEDPLFKQEKIPMKRKVKRF